MSLTDKLKMTLKARPNKWTQATLPGVHIDFTSTDTLDVVFDGRRMTIRQSDVDPSQIGQTLGQKFFENLCFDFGPEGYGSYEDAKLLAAKVASKAERLPHMKIWLIQGR